MSECIADVDKWSFEPKVGIPIECPDLKKGRGCKYVCERLSRVAHACWVETKYDGYRMQVHIDLTRPRAKQIEIIGKDKKNVTRHRTQVIPYQHATQF